MYVPKFGFVTSAAGIRTLAQERPDQKNKGIQLPDPCDKDAITFKPL